MAASTNADGYTGSNNFAKQQVNNLPTNATRPCASTLPKVNPSNVQPLRQPLEGKGLSADAISLIMSSWRTSTQKQYAPYLRKWQQHCRARQIDRLSCTVENGINFLTELFQGGIGYSAINTARSALSSAIIFPSGQQFGSHFPLVVRFMKGVFEQRPSLPRYTNTWDIEVVLRYLSTLGKPQDISLKILTHKLAMLIAILSGQRRQTLHAFEIDSMQLTSDSCTFINTSLLKTSRPGKHLAPIKFVKYAPDVNLCVVSHVAEYLKRTEPLRAQQSNLFISYQRPYKTVSADTISRWLKNILSEAGIDISKFGAHSTRSAPTSAAKSVNVPIDVIMNTAGWSQESSFAKFYHMPVENQGNFGNTLLHKCKHT